MQPTWRPAQAGWAQQRWGQMRYNEQRCERSKTAASACAPAQCFSSSLIRARAWLMQPCLAHIPSSLRAASMPPASAPCPPSPISTPCCPCHPWRAMQDALGHLRGAVAYLVTASMGDDTSGVLDSKVGARWVCPSCLGSAQQGGGFTGVPLVSRLLRSPRVMVIKRGEGTACWWARLAARVAPGVRVRRGCTAGKQQPSALCVIAPQRLVTFQLLRHMHMLLQLHAYTQQGTMRRAIDATSRDIQRALAQQAASRGAGASRKRGREGEAPVAGGAALSTGVSAEAAAAQAAVQQQLDALLEGVISGATLRLAK